MQSLDKLIGHTELTHLLNLRLTHQKAQVQILDALNFKNVEMASREIKKIPGVEESLILQTCNRIEIYLSVSTQNPLLLEKEILAFWSHLSRFETLNFKKYLDLSHSRDVLRHIMRITAGLESMVIGEDQIIGQVQKTFHQTKGYGTLGPVLTKMFDHAIKVGKLVRTQTRISKGAVSLGSIAINLLEDVAGGLKEKKVLIVGAGHVGTMAAKALAARNLAVIFVANRTYERAILLSSIINSRVVTFEKLTESLASADIVIVATSAPHNILTRKNVAKSLEVRQEGKRLIIVDISQPRNVEKEINSLPNVELHNIDNLRKISNSSLIRRHKEAEKAEHIIEQQMRNISLMRRISKGV